ncbi:type II toxin-antitoxin system Phd/YefM family antitoxin [Salmonella enterica]|nr:type II toxin-antitoxin system Phd/YefM family antitoxin [Salmonella enterica]EJO1639683.1 type II toxin-antitoxin system Phd/YefM family antitoxin [Salmonella enterica]
MQTVTSAKLREKLADVLKDVETAPIEITRRGEESTVIMTKREYLALKAAKLDQEFDFMMNRHRAAFEALADR